jgi:hypothetical protein
MLPRAPHSKGGVAVVMARKHLARALTAALRAALKKAPPHDRAFITRWAAETDDRAFERLVTDLIEKGEIGNDPYVISGTVISLARGAWHTATDVKHGVDSISQHAQSEIAELKELAQKADDLAKFCHGSGKLDLASLMSLQVRLGPLITQQRMMPLQQLADLHDREARLLREFAAKEAERDRIRRSRYRISRARRVREQIAFIHLMTAALRELCGKPHYEAVAILTNIAFPGADVTFEHVRAACRPTTRKADAAKPAHRAKQSERECTIGYEASGGISRVMHQTWNFGFAVRCQRKSVAG